MITLANVRDWLRTVVDSPVWASGKMGGGPESITIYSTTGPTSKIAIGGLANTSHANKSVSILVHWTKNANTAELKAQEVYKAMFGQTATIGGKRVIMFDMRHPEPLGVGTDSEGYFEYVIEVNIVYAR